MELLAGLEPATSTYDYPSADAAPGTPVSKRRALPVELQERRHCRLPIVDLRLPIGAVSRNQSEIGNWKLAMHLVGEDRIELSPRVPRTRMLALHHIPKEKSEPEAVATGSKTQLVLITLWRGCE